MTNNYYFVATSLPDLKVGEKPDITLEELGKLLIDNLSKGDYEQVKALRRFYDILNIRAFLLKEPLDPYGNLNAYDLEEALISRDGIPAYLAQYLNKYESTEERLRHFSELVAVFAREETEDATGFLKEYLAFERDLNLVLVGLRAKQLNRDIAVELQYEDPEEDLIAQILSQKDAKVYEPPEKFNDLTILFKEYYKSPLEFYKALCEYRFWKIDDMVPFDDTFSINRILAYLAQFVIVKKWLELDKQKGSQIVDNLIKESS